MASEKSRNQRKIIIIKIIIILIVIMIIIIMLIIIKVCAYTGTQ